MWKLLKHIQATEGISRLKIVSDAAAIVPCHKRRVRFHEVEDKKKGLKQLVEKCNSMSNAEFLRRAVMYYNPLVVVE